MVTRLFAVAGGRLATRLLTVAGRRLATRLLAVAGSCCNGAKTRLPCFPSLRQHLNFPPTPQTHQIRRTKRPTTEQGATRWARKNSDNRKEHVTPLEERENPGNPTEPRISAKSNMLTGHLHLVALKRQTSLVLLPLEIKRRKKGSSPLG